MRQPDGKSRPPGGPYPGLPEEEMPGGPAGARLREFLQGRLPQDQPTEDTEETGGQPEEQDLPQPGKKATRTRKARTGKQKH